MNKTKEKKKKTIEEEYEKYSFLPDDQESLISHLENTLSRRTLSESDRLEKEYDMINKETEVLEFYIHMIPKPACRPRYIVKLKRAYVPHAADNWNFFKKQVEEGHIDIKQIISTPCKMELEFYRPYPSNSRKSEWIMMEKKKIKNISKPDWDNLGKTTDMFNETLWVDDSYVYDAHVKNGFLKNQEYM